jgi:hypothetical protein
VSPKGVLRSALGAGVAAACAVGAVPALAALSSSPSASHTVSTKRIFPTTTTLAPFDAGDASGGGAETFIGSAAAYNDGTLYPALNTFPTAYSAARYVDFRMNDPLPSGLTVSGLQLGFDLRAGSSTGTACFYVELRRTSTSALIGTYGSSSVPIACASGNTTTTTTTTNLSGVTTSSVANDLTIRAYVWANPATKTSIDRVVVTGSTPQRSFTLYPQSVNDVTGTATVVPYQPVSVDGTSWTSAASWQTAFSTTRYERLAYPSYVPTGSTVTAGSFTLSFRPTTSGRNLCFYFAVYDGTTLVATHGSSSAPVACNSTAAFTTSTTPLPEVTTVSRANNAVIRVYMSSNAAGTSRIDQATLAVSYSLD